MTYRPVGFGSHHWEVIDAEGTRWLVTLDELETKRHSRHEPLGAAFDRLRASLAAASDLRAHGHTYAVAPVPTCDGEPLVRTNDRYGVALYPFVDGQSFTWGEFPTPAHRRAVLDLVISCGCSSTGTPPWWHRRNVICGALTPATDPSSAATPTRRA